jgi:putative oxidoreductase
MKQLFPTRLAEILYAIAIGAFGLLHFRSAGDEFFKKTVPSFIPGNPSIWIYITGAAFLLAAIAIIINKYKREACYSLAVMMIIFILTVHLGPAIHDYNFYQPLKDGGLAMAAIMIGNNASK